MELSTKDYFAIILTGLTSIIHLFIGIDQILSEFQILNLLLLLNGLGYLALLVGIYFPNLLGGLTTNKNRQLKIVLIVFTAVTVIAYFAVWMADGLSNLTGMATKVIEILLIIVIFSDINTKK